MLENYTSTQQMSDALKRLVLDAVDVGYPRRLKTLRLLGVFERHAWNPHALELVLEEDDYRELVFMSDCVAASPAWTKGGQIDTLDTIDRLLAAYMQEMPNQPPELYTISTAAEYLDISVSQMKKYVHPENRVGGQLLNSNTRIFTREELDRFNATRRAPGRPSAT